MSETDKRRSARIAHSDQLIVKVVSSTSSALMDGRTLYCSVDNASAEGLCIHVKEPVHRGTVIELWIIAKHRQGTLVMAGEVMWCKELQINAAGAIEFACGIQFFPDPPDALREWRDTYAELTARAGVA